jgi:hypothetical protein
VWRPGDPTSGPALEVSLSTPWDLAEHDGEVVLAMAGTHQLWALSDGAVRVLAGTTGEGLRDGDASRRLPGAAQRPRVRRRAAVVRRRRDERAAVVPAHRRRQR